MVVFNSGMETLRAFAIWPEAEKANRVRIANAPEPVASRETKYLNAAAVRMRIAWKALLVRSHILLRCLDMWPR